jgi:EF hand/EF-hand domain
MTRHVAILMTVALALALSAIDANAQQNPATPQTPAQTQQQQPPQGGIMGPGMMGRGMMGEGTMGRGMGHGMMGRGMMGEGMMGRGMGHGMMGREMMGHGMMGSGGMMSPLAMRMIFALMDSDGDGTVSLQEFQTAHERIFKAMDANKDGVLTLEEIQDFMRGTRAAPPQPSSPSSQQPQ